MKNNDSHTQANQEPLKDDNVVQSVTQRPIKFRAWDKTEDKWYEPTFEAYAGNLFEMVIGLSGDLSFRTIRGGKEVTLHESLPQYKNRYVLMQFTGLLDKNGKEIYEGDICRFSEDGSREQGSVEWSDDFVGWAFNTGDWNKRVSGYSEVTFKVIGNVFENKDLLK